MISVSQLNGVMIAVQQLVNLVQSALDNVINYKIITDHSLISVLHIVRHSSTDIVKRMQGVCSCVARHIVSMAPCMECKVYGGVVRIQISCTESFI